MELRNGEKPLIRILTAGDELSLEEKVNEYIESHPDERLLQIDVQQVEYHARTGSVEFGLMALLVLAVKAA
ncbi:MAG: hypothetical protein N2Z21_01875 [Candidatus Sumerlaeaceae bacterium]|nr:hypothetical protein [Candidatus Sumerlaeaceae bacterium]